MMIYFTSGTTGYPKMVRHSHGYPLGHYITAYYALDLTPEDIHWTMSDTGWAKTAYGKLFGQWIIGCTIVQISHPTIDVEVIAEVIHRFKVTTFCAAPTAYRMFVTDKRLVLLAPKFSSLRLCFSAGEPLNPVAISKWKKKVNLDIYDFYGQTETVALVANYPTKPIKYGSMGLPTPGHIVEIIDDKGNRLDDYVEGNIAVKYEPERPIGLFLDYWKNQKKTDEVLRGGWYYTQDRAYRDEDGYLWYVARSDDVFNSAGYRIGPFEVESALLTHPAVVESAVIGVPHNIRGKIAKAFIILALGYSPSEKLTKDIQDHVKSVTAPYKYPREIEYVKELPKTISGKIRRVELRMMEEAKHVKISKL